MGRKASCKGKTVAQLLFIALISLQLSGCFSQYIAIQGAYQLQLSWGAIPIEEAFEDQSLPKDDLEKLHIITALKRFAQKTLKMPHSDNYSLINPRWKATLHSVSASKELDFEPYEWCFPIVGKVPYLGFFNKSDGLWQENSLKARGFDTMMSEVAGYSTLGFFDDPIWPKMLKKSVGQLSELILHELAHATLYFPGQSDFNESFANFVGKHGARKFLTLNYGEQSEEVLEYIRGEHDDNLYSEWIEELYLKLNDIYKSKQSADKKRNLKNIAILKSQEQFLKLPFQSKMFKGSRPPKINNAFILMSRRYNSSQREFEQLFRQLNGDFDLFYEKLRSIRNDKTPLQSLRKMIAAKISRNLK